MSCRSGGQHLGGLRLRETHEAGEWRQWCTGPDATFFHGWDWNQWVAAPLRARFVPLMIEQDGVVQGVAPVQLRRHGLLATANVVPYSYLGPLVREDLLGPTCVLLRRWALQRGVGHLRLTTATPAGRGVARSGLRNEPYPTYRVRLQHASEDAFFTSLHSDVRNAVRRSIKNGVTVRTATDIDLQELLPQVVDEAIGTPTGYAGQVGRSLVEDPPPFEVMASTAVIGGRPVGVALTVGSGLAGDVAMGWLGGVHRDAQRSQAYTALMWSTLTRARSLGYSEVDMLGAPTVGIANYKAKFRPRIAEHTTSTWALPGFFRAQALRDTMRHACRSQGRPGPTTSAAEKQERSIDGAS